MKTLSKAFLFLALAAACDEESIDHPASIVGQSPEDAADIVAETMCEKGVECGAHNLECSEGVCTLTSEVVDYETCVAELSSEFLDEVLCVPLTTTEEERLDACLGDFGEIACPS